MLPVHNWPGQRFRRPMKRNHEKAFVTVQGKGWTEARRSPPIDQLRRVTMELTSDAEKARGQHDELLLRQGVQKAIEYNGGIKHVLNSYLHESRASAQDSRHIKDVAQREGAGDDDRVGE